MLWVALLCPSLPLDRIQRRLPEAALPPIAVTGKIGNRPCVLLANAPAMLAGVRHGQPVASALAILPSLVLVERNQSDEAAAIREAAYCLLRFTPNLVVMDKGIVAEISASLRLFGGLEALVRSIVQEVSAQGLNVSAAVAPTASAAWLFVRSKPPMEANAASCMRVVDELNLSQLLDRLPLGLLETTREHRDTLAGIGCASLGDLARLPRKGLARRFGSELLTELDCAYGRRPDPKAWFEVPEKFAARLELMARVEHVEGLLFAVKRMIGQLAGWLAARHAAVASLVFILHPEAGVREGPEPTRLTIRLAEPSDDPAHLIGLLRERLDRIALTAPVEELELVADEISLRSAPNRELFATIQSETTTLNRLIEKLSARLGPQAVTRLVPVADYRPEKSQTIDAADTFESSGTARKGTPQISNQDRSPLRPTWLVDHPLPLKTEQHKPVYRSPLTLLAGPERIEAGWWDDKPATRDYFIAENDLGQLLWIFRERTPERNTITQGSSWYLHGLFG